jgi:lysophospholipase L1-like esterase
MVNRMQVPGRHSVASCHYLVLMVIPVLLAAACTGVGTVVTPAAYPALPAVSSGGPSPGSIVMPDISITRIRGSRHPIKYYAYGDSITFAVNPDLPPDGSRCYILQMRDRYDPAALADHSMQGSSGRTSTWAWENLPDYYNPGMHYFIVFFGSNDLRRGINGTATGQNLADIYAYVRAYGSTPVIVIPPLRYTDEDWDQAPDFAITTAFLSARGIPYVTMYDALDSSPGNGKLDSFNGTYMPDGTHPNMTGHARMADYLWEHYFNRSVRDSTPETDNVRRIFPAALPAPRP